MKCVACGKEMTKKDLLYTEGRELVCVNPFTCTEHHPNSVQNILARGAAVRLFNEEELETNTLENLNVSDEMKKRIITVVTKPQSIRLSKLPIAHYIVAKMDESPDLNSISEAVRHCIELAMAVEPLSDKSGNESIEKSRKEQRQASREAALKRAQELEAHSEETSKALTGIVVPDIPKSLNVDWDEIKKQREAEPVPVPNVDDEEDEF